MGKFALSKLEHHVTEIATFQWSLPFLFLPLYFDVMLFILIPKNIPLVRRLPLFN